ncbi:MAG: radical SAM protein [Candidatus Sumerlaeia bacterium]|nr:radical SAM protein [Candidatus Sumerlaeia bacterium]
MADSPTSESLQYPMHSPVYGPVKSWRYGNSLGVDMLMVDSICSFNCTYCQLGNIHQVIDEQKVFVPTEHVIEALSKVNMVEVDIVTFSGSGEPTLALNIGEVIDHIRATYDKPCLVLTNSTWLFDDATRGRLRNASIVDCKLDSASQEMLEKYNRVAKGVTLKRILEGIHALKKDPRFTGKLTIQSMFMPMNKGEAEELAELIRQIQPAEVQLNTPRRPYPREWYPEARGNHYGEAPVATATLKTITLEEAQELELLLRERTGVPIRSVYRTAPTQ